MLLRTVISYSVNSKDKVPTMKYAKQCTLCDTKLWVGLTWKTKLAAMKTDFLRHIKHLYTREKAA